MCADASDQDKDIIHKAKDVLIREVNQAMSRFRSQNYRYFKNNVKIDEDEATDMGHLSMENGWDMEEPQELFSLSMGNSIMSSMESTEG